MLPYLDSIVRSILIALAPNALLNFLMWDSVNSFLIFCEGIIWFDGFIVLYLLLSRYAQNPFMSPFDSFYSSWGHCKCFNFRIVVFLSRDIWIVALNTAGKQWSQFINYVWYVETHLIWFVFLSTRSLLCTIAQENIPSIFGVLSH